MDKGKVLFGLHIPKCAGTTLLDELTSNYGKDVYQSTSLYRNFKNGIKDISEINGSWNFKCYYGHHVHSEMLKNVNSSSLFVFTILRDPLDRLISHYKYSNRLREKVGKKKIDLGEFMVNFPSVCDFIIERFSDFSDGDAKTKSEKAFSIISKFDYVGFSDDMPDVASKLKAFSGIDFDLGDRKNFDPKSSLDDTEIDLEGVVAYLKEDIILYYMAKHLKFNFNGNSFVSDYASNEFNAGRFYKFYSSALRREFFSMNKIPELKSIEFSNKYVSENINSMSLN